MAGLDTGYDPVGAVVLELRQDMAAAAWHSGRVRGAKPAPGDAVSPDPSDPDNTSYRRFVVVSRLGRVRERRAPVQTVRLALRVYGTTEQDATVGYELCSAALHNVGPRLHRGYGIYVSHDDTGGSADEDPDTHQPLEVGVVQLVATTQAVAP